MQNISIENSIVNISDENSWKPLQLLNLYRFILAGLFVVFFFTDTGPSLLGQHNPLLFSIVSIAYLVFSVASSFTIYKRSYPFIIQTNIQVFADIVAITLLMHASGGLTTGMGILIVVAIAGGSIIMAGRLAILYAAVAALFVLAEQIFADMAGEFSTTAYTQAGILGTTFFATALLSHVLANRVRVSEALATRHSIDLANMEQLNEHIIRNMQAGIIVVDDKYKIRLMNESSWHLLGIKEPQKPQNLATISPELEKQLKAWKKDRENGPKPFRTATNNADLIPRFNRIGDEHIGGTVISLEDSINVSQQLQQMKLAALGRLTASIAHEIRNPLGAISHAAQLLEESPALEKGDHRLIEIMKNHSNRMNNIIENILQLSRREQSHPRDIQLKNWLKDFIEELCSIEKINRDSITIDIYPDDTTINIDPSHLQQIVWNLTTNALKYGKKEGEEPRIVLRGGYTEDSRGAYLDIIDFGENLDPETIQKMFEPFYTTSTGGTGLGLYITRELCECNRVNLSYIANPAGGSCFRLFFPESTKL